MAPLHVRPEVGAAGDQTHQLPIRRPCSGKSGGGFGQGPGLDELESRQAQHQAREVGGGISPQLSGVRVVSLGFNTVLDPLFIT
jgi:hypothetical protein